MKTYEFGDLATADLVVDALYVGGRSGNAGDDPLGKLVGVSNQGGFRYLGTADAPRLIVITTTMADPDWPDQLDPETGVLTYFGDNKKPGRELHDTPRFGNRLLRNAFAAAHGAAEGRRECPPFLVFSNAGTWRDVVFRGVAVPGAVGVSPVEDLVAVWRSTSGQRFQNYRALLSILDVPVIPRAWIASLQSNSSPDHAPHALRHWQSSGKIKALRATRSLEIRSREQQLPTDEFGKSMLAAICRHFKDDYFAFEQVAARITQMYLRNVSSIEVTRPRRDGGRDAIGLFRIGDGASGVTVDFALEAKCYSPSNSVGVGDTSRLISRLRHRQFGVLVTTSFVNAQAYKELKEDRHPVVILSGADLVSVLVKNGVASIPQLEEWLTKDLNP